MGIDFGSIFAVVGLGNAKRVEGLDEFELFVEHQLTQAQAHVLALALLGIGSSLPARDRFEVTVSVDGEAASAADDGVSSRARISELFDLGSSSLANVSFRVIIRKQVRDNALSVYDLEAFGRYLANEPLQQVLDAIALRLNGHIEFKCSDLLESGGSASLQFLPDDYAGPAMVPLSSATRERTIALFKETSFSVSLPGAFIPLDFQLDTPVGKPAIDTFFARASAVLSAMYLCNNAEIDSDNTLTYRMAGYKVLEEKSIPIAALADAHEMLGRIASWAYDAGGSTDKVGLARNVLSLHVTSLRDLAAQPEVLNAILSNYQIYLKDNVSAYLDVRNRMAELLLMSTAKTHALVESLLDSVRNGMLLMFTFVLTVVVVNGLKDTGAQLIFSGEYLWIVIIIATLCSIWIHHACKDVVARFDNAITTTAQLLKDSYRNVLVEDEIDQHTSATFAANRNHLTGQVGKYSRLWYRVAAILVAMFAIGYLVNYQLPKFTNTAVNVGAAISSSAPAILPPPPAPVPSHGEHVSHTPPAAALGVKAVQTQTARDHAASAGKNVPVPTPGVEKSHAGAGHLH